MARKTTPMIPTAGNQIAQIRTGSCTDQPSQYPHSKRRVPTIKMQASARPHPTPHTIPRGRSANPWATSVAKNSTSACRDRVAVANILRSEEHTSELQSRGHLVCRLLLEKK